MKIIAVLCILPVIIAAIQDDSEKLRIAKLRALENWTGKWKASMVILDSELKGQRAKGDLEVKWDLDRTALRFDGWAIADPPQDGSKKISYTGLVTFNHNAPYADQKYTAVFSWSEDGNIVTAKGDYKGKDLVMDLDFLREHTEGMQVRVTGDNPRRIMIGVPARGKEKASDWIEVTLRRP